MSRKNPLVSALIPTKNRPRMLKRALQSVFNQTYKPMEIIVIDDGSSDQTNEIVENFDEDITYLKNKKSLGAAKARNRGLKEANGKYVSALDDDDEWNPDRIEQLVKSYEESFSCVTSNVRFQYKNRSMVWRKQEVITLDVLLYSNQVGNQVLAERKRLIDLGGYDENLEAAQDYDLWVRLCERYGPIKNVKTSLQVVHKEHDEDRITNSVSQLNGYLAFYDKHKHLMNKSQKKYQLYNIRRAQGKHQKLLSILGWVPPKKYFKEAKRWFLNTFLV